MDKDKDRKTIQNALVFLQKAKYEMGVKEFSVLVHTINELKKIMESPEEVETYADK